MDLNVYIKDIENIDLNKLSEFLNKYILENIEVDPSLNLKEDDGYIPFKYIRDNRKYVTGFEYFLDEFNFEEFYNDSMEDYEEEKKTIFSIFNKNKVKYAVDKIIDEKLSKCEYEMTLSISTDDIYEERIAIGFAIYLIKYYDAILYNTYSGKYYGIAELKELYDTMLEDEKVLIQNGAIMHLSE